MMLKKIKLANKVIFLLLLMFGFSVTGVSVYSDWQNGDVKKENLLAEMGSRILLVGKASRNGTEMATKHEQAAEERRRPVSGETVEAIDENGLIQTAVLMNSGELEFKKDQAEEADELQEKKEQAEKERKAKEAILEEAKFSFAAIGDSESYKSDTGYDKELKDILEKADEDKPDFLLFTGDLIAATGDVDRKINQVIKLIKKYHNNYYIAFGGHDLECGKSCVDKWKEIMFDDKSDKDDVGKMYHSFDFQNTHFVLLSTDWPKKHSVDEAQFDWLKEDLEGIDREKIKNVIVVQHVPPITFFHKSAKKCHDMSCDASTQAKLIDLYKKTGVDLVLSGHENVFDHKVKAGIDFVLVGSAGQSVRHKGTMEGDIYSLIEVEGGRINLLAYDVASNHLVRKIEIK